MRDPRGILPYVTLVDMTPEMTLAEWINYGKAQGFCSDPVCDTHDGLPYTEEEISEFDAQGDPCVNVVRIYGTATSAV